MYYFTPETIAQANKNIEALDPKVGGLLCVLSCLEEDIKENVSYTVDGENLRKQLSFSFDKEHKDSFDWAKPSYIIFAKNWVATFFDNFLRNKVDLLSCAVFFLRRQGFEREYSKEEVIDYFVKRFNLKNCKDHWFYNGNKVQLAYNRGNVEDNQAEFYSMMNYSADFKSILFTGVIKKSAADLKAAGQIQTLYSGSAIHKCLLLSDEPLDQYYVMVNSKENNDLCGQMGLQNNEDAFKKWFAMLVKENGEHYSENTRNQYLAALKAAGPAFAEAIGPVSSVFEVSDIDTCDRVITAIKDAPNFEEFNKARGNGSLSAGLDLYRRFLLERDDINNMFSPEWFREKASEYPTLDEEASQLLADFQSKFAPDFLASLSGVEMLNTIFLNAANSENLCRFLEFGPQIKDTFGSIKGGTAYKYGLYYSTQGAWMTGSGQKPHQLTEDEAIEVGAKLRDHLVAGANAIKEYGSLTTLEDYRKLHKILHEVTEGDIERVWFLKYYQMLYPELFATNYSDYAQRTVLNAIGEEKEKYALVRMGQIRLYANKCGISNVMFNKIFWEYYSEEAVAAKAEPSQDICYNTGYSSAFPRNRILFGAPGTGKSFTLNQERASLLADGGEYERVTFHPDYSYANFVGTYKPVPCKDDQGHDAITYAYVPGPFMRTYVKALQNSRTDAPKPYLLVIEEINRANVAAVFGDVFQLLDRGDDEVSEYPIQASEDIKKYLAGELGGNPDDYAEIRIPDNMFIWATMNSADQGVFPMDTAFKRRWDFTYLGIDDSEAGIVGKKVILGQGDYRRIVEWNALRKAINNELLTYKVNEDKLMGPYFISKKNLPEGEMIDPTVFTRIFKNKVIMYLFDDAAKQKRITLFGGCDEKAKNQYSKICREFDTKGVYIFCEGISSQFIDNVPEDDEE